MAKQGISVLAPCFIVSGGITANKYICTITICKRISMTETDIFRRCIRELKNSKNRDMLIVAKNYCELFIKQYQPCATRKNALALLYEVTKKRLR